MSKRQDRPGDRLMGIFAGWRHGNDPRRNIDPHSINFVSTKLYRQDLDSLFPVSFSRKITRMLLAVHTWRTLRRLRNFLWRIVFLWRWLCVCASKTLSFENRMNIFRLVGDLSHLLAIVLLLWKIWKTRSCAGKF